MPPSLPGSVWSILHRLGCRAAVLLVPGLMSARVTLCSCSFDVFMRGGEPSIPLLGWWHPKLSSQDSSSYLYSHLALFWQIRIRASWGAIIYSTTLPSRINSENSVHLRLTEELPTYSDLSVASGFSGHFAQEAFGFQSHRREMEVRYNTTKFGSYWAPRICLDHPFLGCCKAVVNFQSSKKGKFDSFCQCSSFYEGIALQRFLLCFLEEFPLW